jgi:hypothetical protein
MNDSTSAIEDIQSPVPRLRWFAEGFKGSLGL